MDYKTEYQKWLDNVSNEERAELIALDEDQIKERFFAPLDFGTAGMRGILRLGINGMNPYTVARATQGLALYIKSEGQCCCDQGVVISYDSRINSALFAKIAAQVLAANNIKVYLYDALRPVPLLSFGVRFYKAFAGIMITASHNPKEYNGYKVYGPDGAQLSLEPAQQVLNYINALDYFNNPLADFEKAASEGLIELVGKDVDDAYLKEILALVSNHELINSQADSLKIVYTPLHGTGLVPIMNMYKALGLSKVELVKAQTEPDGAFPTTASPNPENLEALTLGIEQAKASGASLVIGTDRDCDRLGVAVKDNNGEFIGLSGNQLGCLMLDYLLSQKQAKGTLPANGVAIKTIVSTEMARAIAQHYGVELVEVLTGFKFIGEKIKEYEAAKNHTFLFGFEESHGYLQGTHARDKDGVVASMLISETAAYYQSRGMTLYQGLQELFQKYGYYLEQTISYTFDGLAGMEKIKDIMSAFRSNCPDTIGGIKVLAMRDYQAGTRYSCNGTTNSMDLPKSNVIYYELDKNCWACIRPSGTEPKLKLYIGSKAETQEAAAYILTHLKTDLESFIKI